MERGWLACALRRFSWQIKGRAAVQRKASSAQVRRLTATGQDRFVLHALGCPPVADPRCLITALLVGTILLLSQIRLASLFRGWMLEIAVVR